MARSDANQILDELARIANISQTDIFADADIIETDGGVVIFLTDKLRLRSILSEWAQGLVEELYSQVGFKLDPNDLKNRETGEKATPEQAAEIVKNVKKEFSDKIFRHSLNLWREHLPQGIDDAVLELMNAVHLRAFLDWMSEEHAETSSEAHYFNQLLKDANARFKQRFLMRGRGGSKPRLEHEVRLSLSSRFHTLCLKIKDIKIYYDGERALFERNNQKRGFNSDQWLEHWLAYASERFPNDDAEFLAFFADLDNYESSVPGIAYKQLARETGHAVEYVKKLVGQAKKRTNPKRTLKPKD